MVGGTGSELRGAAVVVWEEQLEVAAGRSCWEKLLGAEVEEPAKEFSNKDSAFFLSSSEGIEG